LQRYEFESNEEKITSARIVMGRRRPDGSGGRNHGVGCGYFAAGSDNNSSNRCAK